MVQVNRVCLKFLFINRPQFLVDSNGITWKMNSPMEYISTFVKLLTI